MYHDTEINALSNVYEALKSLNNKQIKRIIDWVTSKFALDLKTGQKEVGGSPKPAAVETFTPDAGDSKPGQAIHTVEETQPQTVVPGKDFMKYHSFEEIFSASMTRSAGAKMLLAAAYLQEKENIKELSCYDISSRLKKVGEEVNNPSVALNSLASKKPALLLQVSKGSGTKSRRKFTVTEEGIRIARNYINE